MSAGFSGFRGRGTECHFHWLLFLVLFGVATTVRANTVCAVCQKEIHGQIYTWKDKVTQVEQLLCGDCIVLPNKCYLCSMPVLKGFTTLPDGRVICQRDLASVIIDDQQAAQICDQVKSDLDRQFIRFITLPETNVTVQLMDRIKLQELYRVIGNDHVCPNTLGCTETKTNDGNRVFEISILSGQPREDLMTTCVHEYAHTWIDENVSTTRRKKIGKDAVEGFCELMSYLFAEDHGLAAGKSNILANFYTRGQLQLFIAACHQYGFADVVDWMKAGDDPLLLKDDLSRLRRMADRPKTRIVAGNWEEKNAIASIANPPPKLPEELVLQGIIWSKTQPTATVNGWNFDLKQEVTLQLRDGPIIVRCLEIHPASVVLQTNKSPELLKLEMK